MKKILSDFSHLQDEQLSYKLDYNLIPTATCLFHPQGLKKIYRIPKPAKKRFGSEEDAFGEKQYSCP